jgi:hypothetical protein
MRRVGLLLSLALTSSVISSGAAIAQSDKYFPDALLSQKTPCPGNPEHSEPALSDFEREWFSQALSAAGEPSLSKDQNADALRFLWLRSFHRPVVVKVVGLSAPHPQLVAIELSGAGGYDPGKPVRRMERELTSGEAAGLRRVLESSETFAPPKSICEIGVDGAEWILERSEHGRYEFVHQWSPKKGPVYKVGTFLLDLTDWKFGPRY